MSGLYDPGAKSLAVTPSEWIYQRGGNAQAIGLTARLDDSGLRIAGALKDGPAGCSAFEAIKFTRDERPPHERGIVPMWEKNRRAMLHKSACEPFVRWAN